MEMKLRLISKMTLSTSVLLLLSMTLFAWINVETLRTLLIEEAVSMADKLGETIIKTTHYQMLEDDRKRVYEMISEVGTQKDIERVRLITKEGLTIFSTDKKEIGTYLDKSAEACNMCHRSDTPLVQASSMNRIRIFRTRDGKEVLGLAKAIYNEEKCYTAPCHFHPREAKILGVLDIDLSLDNMQSQLAANRYKITILTICMLGLISLCMVFLIHEQINQPLKKLLTQTEKIAEGNLESAVEITSTDEIGELGIAFNGMTEKLKKAREELEDWGKNLEVKVEERTRELNKLQAQLVRSEKLASLGELVAGIAHEINNPLTGILVFTSLMGSDAKLHPALKSDLDTIIRETERCASIVRGLLEFARESIPQKNLSSLNGIMDAALALVRHQSMFQNIDIVKNYHQAIPDVMVDHNQVEQVFVNMLLNAGHAMPEGGELTIGSGVTKDGGYAYITITDTGCGIPEEIMSRIFDPFFSTKENKGTGLGLSISYGIINNHGGMIEVQSTVGVGTTFTIMLPVPTEEDSLPAES
jgi:two-component system NtrC family sensor kinase